MVREELVESAVSFLQDPSVASAALDKRIQFLQSKNLTQEEIDVSLARAGESPSSSNAVTPSSYTPSTPSYRQSPPPPGYGAYPPGYWQQPPPPELPKRDWRDWFIMATVMGGVSYGLYFTAKRYIIPLIAPPTPPQIEQDKSAIDASFEKAFALLDQLATDTAALKASETSRTERLDTAISEMESVLASLKESNKRRDDDARRTEDEIRGLRALIPKAMEAQKESQDARLKELGTELKSLKTLVGNRVGGGAGAGAPSTGAPARPYQSVGAGVNMFGAQGTASTNINGSPAVAASPTPAASGAAGGSNDGPEGQSGSTSASTPSPAAAPDRAQSSSPYGRLAGGRAAIPAWQMAAAKKSQADAAATERKDTSESGTVTEASSGA
ncbi:hypothetical protein W97_04515 [Coniosporium apollinis CBS 100218]|uniref:Peroxisomal membrane protein PEX14 n=1 Tax=Coniosporium apollinis (strain CBS 100218) TaxID=1168221 RepID=R7YTM4_CONA1|nr:uncharacterized protein W97_04515 [Coniosporium apollinis CBS 100218]EON65277.1 hypothetical protein W97_04515 [Coniosporium apollinis CBS 100218]